MNTSTIKMSHQTIQIVINTTIQQLKSIFQTIQIMIKLIHQQSKVGKQNKSAKRFRSRSNEYMNKRFRLNTIKQIRHLPIVLDYVQTNNLQTKTDLSNDSDQMLAFKQSGLDYCQMEKMND